MLIVGALAVGIVAGGVGFAVTRQSDDTRASADDASPRAVTTTADSAPLLLATTGPGPTDPVTTDPVTTDRPATDPASTGADPSAMPPPTTPDPSPTPTAPALPASSATLVKVADITGSIASKSVVASGTGLFFAQNMMYYHTVTVYNSQHQLVATIPDSVTMANFGISGHPGNTRGAPVEAAFTPDARYVYVSNYSMFGSGYGPEGTDTCKVPNNLTNSYVYRIDVQALRIDQVIEVGKVPKFLAVTPDGHYLLVSNWCSFTMSVIDIATQQTVRIIPLAQWPRGIAVSPDSTTAYVANFGTSEVAVVDIATGHVGWIKNVGAETRHVNITADGRYLFVTCSAAGYVAKIDLQAAGGPAVIAKVHTGVQPRSAALSSDNTHLYVVNYDSATMSVIDTASMTVTQTLPTAVRPIGIAYDPQTANVWMSMYSGHIYVYQPAQ